VLAQYNIMIDVAMKAGQEQRVRSLQADMTAAGLQTDPMTYCMLAHNFRMARRYEEAMGVLESAKTAGKLNAGLVGHARALASPRPTLSHP
jgi:hypothetical protein